MSERPSILVVDDTPDNLSLMSGLLKEDYQVKVAPSGERALRIASSDKPPDLILLDVMMPEMDGYEVCRRLKDDERTREIPVVFLTAKSEVADETLGFSLGAVDYITKPISPPIVLARVRTQLALKRVSDFLRDQNAFLETEVQRRTEELLATRLAHQVVERDLKLALRLQRSMLPPARFELQGWGVSAHLEPARTIGGDLYDYFRLGTDRLLFAVGDVSDKGVAAALFMVRVLTLLRWLANSCADPSQVLRQLNEALCKDNDACMFVTLGLGVVHLQTGELVYAHGGHEAPVLVTPGQAPRLLELASGPALGLTDEGEYPLHCLHLEVGQQLLLVSDGVNEANNPVQDQFGEERLLKVCAQGGSDLVHRCQEAVRRFADGAEPNDDVTILLLSHGGGVG
ncbi:MAG: SpoIIE family protein phosphatase [Candidatus Eremiobacteraeota bacterium]|nr:SpoIIE family protein phosphatase [Candidatus Eremiobacteraeota bacterium]MCW5871468.1 SpoIIE family protein phosphatase [Candidatus Eremiobacteraeota bacterium]